MKCTLEKLLALSDANATVAEMCVVSGLRMSRVYGLLRKHRPARPRQRRRPTSDVPDKIRVLATANIVPKRIAFLLEITPAYVYQILGSKVR